MTRWEGLVSLLSIFLSLLSRAKAQCDAEDFSVSYDTRTVFSVSRANGTCSCPNGFRASGPSTLQNVSATSVRASAGLFGDGSGLTNLRNNPDVVMMATQVAALNASLQSALQTISLMRAQHEAAIAQQNATIQQLQAQLGASPVAQQVANLTTLVNCLLSNSPCGNQLGKSSINPATSCLAIQQAAGGPTGLADGVYWLKPSAYTGAAFQAYCDFSIDGGGWTLILNYNHLGTTSPAPVAVTTYLPRVGSSSLGVDESGNTLLWGHAAPALLATVVSTETRWFCRTALHSRVVHFKSSNAACLQYLKTGTGVCTGVQTGYTALPGHTAALPASIDAGFNGQGTLAATAFPIYRSGTNHWGIQANGRWECDDFPGDASQSTLHRMYAR